MKIPPRSTKRYMVLNAIHRHGPMTPGEVSKRVKWMTPDIAKNAIAGCVGAELLHATDRKYDLTEAARKYFEGCELDQQEELQAAAARASSAFKPLSLANMGWLQEKREPIRNDVSFKNGSTDFRAFVGYLAG